MGLNRLALAAVAAACIGAAGVGGYLATRQNVTSMAAPEAAAASAVPNPKPVQETEASVSPAATPASAASDVAPAPVPSPAAATSAPVTKRPGLASQSRPTPTPKQVAAASRQTEPPTLDRSWPSGSTSQAPSSSPASPADSQASPIPHSDDHTQEAPRVPEPPAKTFDELVVAADSVMGLQVDTSLSSERAKVEDRVEAHVVRDVRVGGHVAIPAGTHAIGTVVVVDRGGKFKERARLGIRFQTL